MTCIGNGALSSKACYCQGRCYCVPELPTKGGPLRGQESLFWQQRQITQALPLGRDLWCQCSYLSL